MSRKDSTKRKRAMDLDMELLNKLNTLKLVRLPLDRKVGRTRRVFDAKRNGD